MQRNNIEQLIQELHEQLRINPNNSAACNNLGSIYYRQLRLKEAIPLFEKAIRITPAFWEAHYNLANSLIKQDMVLQAIEHYKRVLALNPGHENAKINLAMSLVSIKDYTNALPYLKEIAIKDPNNTELQGHLAECYLEVGKSEEAIKQYIIAIDLDPNRPEWHHNLAVLYLRDKQNDLAKIHFAHSLALEPGNQTAQHMLNALEEKNDISNAPSEYVRALFDQYAVYYNQHMLNNLEYNVPVLLRQEIGKHLSLFAPQQYVLDLGCGTGLCGPYFRDISRFLVGMDLSQAMLQQAKALGAYDALVCGNILDAIPGLGSNYFDIVIAADVLGYIGDLAPLFTQVSQSLKNDGKFAFTVEKYDGNENYHLQTTGRFAHSEDYIYNICAQLGLNIRTRQEIILRKQNLKDMPGILFLVTK